MIKTILNTQIMEVKYYPKGKILYMEWKQSANIEDYQRIMIDCLEFGREQVIDSLISDIRKQKFTNPEQRKWFESQILPTVIRELKVKRAAAIYDGSRAQQKYLENIKKVTSKYNLPLKLFTKEEAAFKWIRKSNFKLKELLFGH